MTQTLPVSPGVTLCRHLPSSQSVCRVRLSGLLLGAGRVSGAARPPAHPSPRHRRTQLEVRLPVPAKALLRPGPGRLGPRGQLRRGQAPARLPRGSPRLRPPFAPLGTVESACVFCEFYRRTPPRLRVRRRRRLCAVVAPEPRGARPEAPTGAGRHRRCRASLSGRWALRTESLGRGSRTAR